MSQLSAEKCLSATRHSLAYRLFPIVPRTFEFFSPFPFAFFLPPPQTKSKLGVSSGSAPDALSLCIEIALRDDFRRLFFLFFQLGRPEAGIPEPSRGYLAPIAKYVLAPGQFQAGNSVFPG